MLQEFNHLMDYIEKHLTEEISGKEISKIVALSDYHFRRMFSYMAGMSLNDYIKNRRLSEANVELIEDQRDGSRGSFNVVHANQKPVEPSPWSKPFLHALIHTISCWYIGPHHTINKLAALR